MTQGITHIIKNDAGVQALIGQTKDLSKYKVFPGICDQPEQYPYTVVKVLSKVALGKCKGVRPETFSYTFSVASFDVNYLVAQSIDKAIFWALDNQAGTVNGVIFKAITFENTNDDAVNTPTLLHVKVSTYTAIVNEVQAT